MFNQESDKLVKYGYGLNVKALWPTNLEKQNVKLVCNIFNEFIVNGLLALGPIHNLEHYNGTATFLNIILNW